MSNTLKVQKATVKEKKKGKKKHTALVLCQDRNQLWTTQKQFWQWVRDGIVCKTKDNPLTGKFIHRHQESFVVLSNTVLNRAYPNHLHEALRSRHLALGRK